MQFQIQSEFAKQANGDEDSAVKRAFTASAQLAFGGYILPILDFKAVKIRATNTVRS
jgi:hypothetical protein